MKRLILILGKGQFKSKEYKKAKYFINDENNFVDTPFIGEAILKLSNESYDTIHILGTQDSMWGVLCLHFNADADSKSDEIFDKLEVAISEKTLHSNKEILIQLSNSLSKSFKSNVSCELIEIGKTEEELWDIFIKILDIPEEGDELSIDMTHGLRYQSFLLYNSIVYFSKIKRIKINSLFYGAFELSEYYNEKSPILNLSQFIELTSWIDAANEFDKYSLTNSLVSLLNKNNIDSSIVESIKNFSNTLQTNYLGNIDSIVQKLYKSLNSIPTTKKKMKPFELLKPLLLKLPENIYKKKNDWAKKLVIANNNWSNEQYGLSILSAWEAVIDRLNDIIFNRTDLKKDVFEFLNSIAVDAHYLKENQKKFLKEVYSGTLEMFPNDMSVLKSYRNAIAHANFTKGFSVNDLIKKCDIIIKKLNTYLNDPILLKLKDIPDKNKSYKNHSQSFSE